MLVKVMQRRFYNTVYSCICSKVQHMIVMAVVETLERWGRRMTIWKSGTACGFAIVLGMGASSALALGPVNAVKPSPSAQLLDASFFGRPYPYGYTGWGPCVRYVPVETPSGTRLRRVWICR
jgi:hypothetical protein